LKAVSDQSVSTDILRQYRSGFLQRRRERWYGVIFAQARKFARRARSASATNAPHPALVPVVIDEVPNGSSP